MNKINWLFQEVNANIQIEQIETRARDMNQKSKDTKAEVEDANANLKKINGIGLHTSEI